MSSPNRWRIPIGAVLVHICIGSVYAWSTFNRPIQALFPDQPWWFSPPYTTFTTALALLGLSAAFGGPWVERRGPRVAATAAALFFGCGLLIGGAGLALRQPILVFLGAYWFFTNSFPGNCFTNRFISRLSRPTDAAEAGRPLLRITSSMPTSSLLSVS